MTSHVRLTWLTRGLLVLGIFLVALWSTAQVGARGFQSAASARLDAGLLPAAPDPVPSLFAVTTAAHPPKQERTPGEVLGRLEIPRLGIGAIVAEGTDATTLQVAVGHLPSTASLGRPGNCALAGHRDTFLRGLGDIRADDLIRVVALESTYTYQVLWTEVVVPRRVDVLDSTATRSLTLITCYPFRYVGHAPKRFVVRAQHVGSVARAAALADRAPIARQGTPAAAGPR